MSERQEAELFDSLKTVVPTAAVLSSIFTISKASSTKVVRRLPQLMKSLENREHLLLNSLEMSQLCKKTFEELKVNQEEANYLEESTRMQSQSLLWFEHRSGRITASKFYAVRHTSITSPSMSLLHSLLNKTPKKLEVPSLKWGITHESIARDAYLEAMHSSHIDLEFSAAGLFVNPDFPHLGASPDGIIDCQCCGEGLLEIKCPFKYRDEDPNTISDTSFYIESNDDGTPKGLRHTHEYFYQVQGQLAVCCKEYCDFVCWTPKGMYVERIVRHMLFFEELKQFLNRYFIRIILPVLLTGTTKVLDLTQPTCSEDSQREKYCKCGKPEQGRMITCDNPKCLISRYHYKCVGIKRKPKGSWFCCSNCESAFNNNKQSGLDQ